MIDHEINDYNNFISGWYMDDTSVCDEIIQMHNDSPGKHPGIVGTQVRPEWKNSTDIELDITEMPEAYQIWIDKCIREYGNKYQWSRSYGYFGFTERINIQKYDPNGGFPKWHTERTTGEGESVFRHLAFMTYLNDVDDKGETEFFYQNAIIRPVKGLTLIWGTDWTFTHRGIPSPTQTKYIATGWLSYTERGDN